MKLRFAQFGISHDHAPSKARTLKTSEDVDFVGIYEPSTEARETLGSNDAFEGVQWLSSAKEVLDDETIVGVAAQGRVSENLDFARAAVEHGKHVWLDKPAGDDLEAFRSVLDIASKKGMCVQLGYMFRYNAGFQFVLDWANSGKLGKIFSVRGRISTRPSDESLWARWDARGEHEGGIMFILAPHLIDIIVALLGRPEHVTSFSQNLDSTFPWAQDNTAAVFEYPDAMATIESAAAEVSSGESRRLEVYGTAAARYLNR